MPIAFWAKGVCRGSIYLFFAGFLLAGLLGLTAASTVSAKSLYSYRDHQGTNVITDDYDRIPAEYRANVVKVEQEGKSSRGGSVLQTVQSIGNATINFPGMTHYQSHALTVAGALFLLCLTLRFLSGSQVMRFLSLWGLVMLGLTTPILIYFSQDGPLDILRGQASHIQNKQQEHLKHVQ
ncbi:hypothetical protein [Petrachloros mirabilis]